ncbi:MAM and LDL-receptor class A domain-containing protein 2-like isoform X2 [Dreissena polymorpha]|uniref:MAM and LDL-receptor class A domain-containing protein 2-like isoform X2 n=1 Tax=Dreissena polymorpha TaxID=45954 RepID=UPI002264437D|nr:MAM and LDL-receptor class A domain-containing protein 2-like isoform X2 [Dreissena polymorpha]
MIGYLSCLILLPYFVFGQRCASQNNCNDCMNTNPFIPIKNVTCSWCPLDRKCHTFGSNEIVLLGLLTKIENPCKRSMIIKEDSQCFLYSDEGLAFDPTKAKIFAGLSAAAYAENMTPTSRYNIYPDNEDPETMKGVGSKPDHKTYFGIPIGTFCETDLNYNPTMESRFQVNRCQVVSAQELDDMALAETTIKNVSESVCDFTRDFCDWIRTPNITFNFQRKNGPSDSNKKTGPSADRHNSASGYYVYADASDNEHKIAKLRSPNFVSGNYCIEFYYHMFGDDMGSLELLMYTSKTPRKAVFKKEGNQDNHWRHERGTVDTTKLGSADMHFEFVATIGKGYRSDIAIDFVSILKGKC